MVNDRDSIKTKRIYQRHADIADTFRSCQVCAEEPLI
jgi:hypothetical protein